MQENKWCRWGDLNTIFEELSDWEAQLKPLEKQIYEELGGPEL